MLNQLQLRDDALLGAVGRVLPSCATLRAAVAKALEGPAPSFFLDPEYVYPRMVHWWRTGQLPPRLTALRRILWMDIARLLTLRRRRHPREDFYTAVAEVLAAPAPRFYLSHLSAEHRIHRLLSANTGRSKL